MSKLDKPNAFIFKAFMDGEYKYCVCPRVDDKWSENDIYVINNNDDELLKSFDDVLDNEKFSVIFVGYEKDPSNVGGFKISNVNSYFMKSDTEIARLLYQQGRFFNTVEKGYKKFYEQQD